VADALIVPFAGEGSGAGGLTWGQQAIWRAFEALGQPMWLTRVKELPQGTTVEDVADQIAYQLSRHQSLRTRLIVTDDAPIQQVVSASGEFELSIVDVADDDDPHQVATEIEDRWQERDAHYDWANDWPVRFAVVRHRGVLRYQVRGFSHIVADGFGAMVLQEDLAARDPVTGAPPGPVTATQPLEEAQWQASPAGKRRSLLAEQYWERLLRSVPARRFPEPADKPEARYGRVFFDSRAAYIAIQAIAARTKFDTSPVLFAAFSVGMAQASGINPLMPRLYANNRFRPGLAKAVSQIAQTCPCLIDVAGITFDEAVQRAYYASLSAYRNSYFEPVKIREVLAAVSAERGEQVDVNLVCNDTRLRSPRGAADSPLSPEDIAAAAPLTTMTWEDRPALEDFCTFIFQDSDEVTHRGAPPTVNVVVAVDTHYVPRAYVEGCLRELEAIVIRAAFDPDVPTGV
jgi:Condensation domain